MEKHDDVPRAVSSVTVSSAGVTDPDQFQRRVYGADLNLRSGFDLILIKAVVIHNDSFLIPYLYVFYCTSIEEVPETLGNVSKCDFYVCDA